jgi:hypothetical protein
VIEVLEEGKVWKLYCVLFYYLFIIYFY